MNNLQFIPDFEEFLYYLDFKGYECNITGNNAGNIMIVEVYSFGLYIYKNEKFYSFISEEKTNG